MTLGPMLSLSTFITPSLNVQQLDTMAWRSDGGAVPDVQQLVLSELGPGGGARWTVIMPGGPDAGVDASSRAGCAARHAPGGRRVCGLS